MLPGRYEPGSVIDAELKIYVDGVLRPHLSASWEGNVSGGLPESLVVAGDGVYSRTGSITWSAGTAVVDMPLAPVGEARWMPRQGAHVRIVATVGGVEFPRFWGYLGASTHSLMSDTVTTQISDNLHAGLGEIVTIPPIADDTSYGRTAWVAYRALEQAGYGILPPVSVGETCLQVSSQYGAGAAVGELVSIGAGFGSGVDGLFTYQKHVVKADPSVLRNGRDVMVYTRVYNPRVDASIELRFKDGAVFKLAYTAATRQFSGWSSATGNLPAWPAEGGDHPVLAVKLNKNGVRRWRSAAKDDSDLVRESKLVTLSLLESVTCDMTLGLKVDYLTDGQEGARRVGWMSRPAPRIQASELERVRVPATRGFENVTCKTVIDEWCAATLSTVWVDEEGRAHMAARDQLAAGQVTVRDRVDERVFAGSWKTARDGVRSGVVVKGLYPTVQGKHKSKRLGNARDAIMTAWEPSSITEIQEGTPLEIFAEWPEEVDVIGLDTNFRPVIFAKTDTHDYKRFNESWGTWWCISFENPGPTQGYRWTGGDADHEDLSGKLEVLGQRAVKMTLSVTKRRHREGDAEKYYLCTPTLGVDALRYGGRGKSMPILRCSTLVRWTKYTVRQAVQNAPDGAPIYTLDAGWWLHRDDAARVAAALAEEVGTERVTLDGLEMLWDPRKQIGDTVALEAGRWGVEAIVAGYHEEWHGMVPTYSVELQVKKVTSGVAGHTYTDLARVYGKYQDIPAGATYDAVARALPGRVS